MRKKYFIIVIPMHYQEQPLGRSIDLIAKAIDKHLSITFRNAENEKQVVEPFVVGIQKETNFYVLKCYRSFPVNDACTNNNWESIELDKIHDLQLVPVRARNIRNGHNKLEADIAEVIACVPGYEYVFSE